MKGICYIVGAGEDFGLDFQPTADDMVIAADGGYAVVKQAGLCPDLVVGDFDSLGAAPLDETVVTLPAVKDVTDTWAAIQLGMERGFRRFYLYGCTGGRFEHTLANVQTVAHVTGQGMECRLYDKNQVITAVSGGTMTFDADHTGFVSVFAHTDTCKGVTIRGMKYELEDAQLTNRFPLGVSNEFLGKESSVSVKEGIAIVIFDR